MSTRQAMNEEEDEANPQLQLYFDTEQHWTFKHTQFNPYYGNSFNSSFNSSSNSSFDQDFKNNGNDNNHKEISIMKQQKDMVVDL